MISLDVLVYLYFQIYHECLEACSEYSRSQRREGAGQQSLFFYQKKWGKKEKSGKKREKKKHHFHSLCLFAIFPIDNMFGSTNFSMLWEHKKKAAPANAWVSAVCNLCWCISLSFPGPIERWRVAVGRGKQPFQDAQGLRCRSAFRAWRWQLLAYGGMNF